MKTVLRTASAAALLATLAGGAWAQCNTFQKLNKASPSMFDRYGISVALDQGPTSPLVIVGDPGFDGPAGTDVGAFSVWAKGGGGWSSVGGVFNGGAGAAANDHMGEAVAMTDPYVIVGVPDSTSGQGKARIYERTGAGYSWSLKTEAVAYFPNGGDAMGTSVAISTYGGGWAVSGAPFHSFHGVSDAGAAFFFTRSADGTWAPAFQIWGGDFSGDTNEHRGQSVAMAKTSRYAVVGGPGGNANGAPAGSGVAYIVQRLDNGLVGSPSVMNPASPEADAHFGWAVAVEGDVIVVSAPDKDVSSLFSTVSNAGRIYIYERSGFNWNLVAERSAADMTSNMRFGSMLSTDGSRIAVGAEGTNSVYIFEKLDGQWTQTSKLTDPDNPGSFSNSVSVLGTNVAVGDLSDDEGGVMDRGAVYTLVLPENQASDVCSTAPAMPLSEFQACTTYATVSSPANATTCGTGATQGPDIWYTFTPACSGNAIIDTFGSNFDTVLSVHTGCPNILGNNTLTCNDDASFPAPNNRASLVTFNYTAGETYYVRIAGYNGTSGTANVRPSFYYSYTNDTCSGAVPVTEGQHTFGNCGAHTEDTAIMCPSDAFVPRNDLWYSFTPAQSGPYTIDTCGSALDTVMAIYTGCPVAGQTPIACDDDAGTGCGLQAGFQVPLTAGTSYRIRVGNFTEGGTGAFNLNINYVPACDPDLNQDGNVDQDDIAYLINVIGGGANPTGIDPDFNRDGNADQDDIGALINVVAGGACP